MTLKIHLPGIIFTQPERCLPPEKSAMFHKPFIFSASHNHRSPAWHLCVKLSCFGPFTTCPLRIQDAFYCFSLVFIMNVWQSLEMFPHLNSFHWKTAKWKTGNTLELTTCYHVEDWHFPFNCQAPAVSRWYTFVKLFF